MTEALNDPLMAELRRRLAAANSSRPAEADACGVATLRSEWGLTRRRRRTQPLLIDP